MMNHEKLKSKQTIIIRSPDSIYQVEGKVENGSFHGRWHFSFGDYNDRDYTHFGTLRAFNDDTLSPGAIWPLHPHSNIEIVTYCAGGEFRHVDENGSGGVLKKGWVQHTTIGRGLWHSEVNNHPDEPMRFIQMWFLPAELNLEPSIEQKRVEKKERTNKFLRLVANQDDGALSIASDAQVSSCFMERGESLPYQTATGQGAYLYALEGGPVLVNGRELPALGAARIIGGGEFRVEAVEDSEMLLVDVPLAYDSRP